MITVLRYEWALRKLELRWEEAFSGEVECPIPDALRKDNAPDGYQMIAWALGDPEQSCEFRALCYEHINAEQGLPEIAVGQYLARLFKDGFEPPDHFSCSDL